MTTKIRPKHEGTIFQRSNGTWRAQVSIDGQPNKLRCKNEGGMSTLDSSNTPSLR